MNTTVHCSICSQLNNTHGHIDIPLKQSIVSLSGGYWKPTYAHSVQACIIICTRTCPLLNSCPPRWREPWDLAAASGRAPSCGTLRKSSSTANRRPTSSHSSEGRAEAQVESRPGKTGKTNPGGNVSRLDLGRFGDSRNAPFHVHQLCTFILQMYARRR